MYHATDIADYILNKYQHIQNLKLQKILYFIQAEFLVAKHRPCFKDAIEAWDFGPVIPTIYLRYRTYGNTCIPVFKKIKIAPITRNDQLLIDGITEKCLKFSNTELTDITTNQTPYLKNHKKGHKQEIPVKDIQGYFE